MKHEELKVKVNEYINSVLLKLDNLPTNIIEGNKEQMVSGIIARLFSRKFRKYAISDDVKTNLTEKIRNIVQNDLPITFIPSFGGYKHWWSPTYPQVDWAEVFNMKFMLKYLAPIFNSYKSAPVSIEYESEEVILSELINQVLTNTQERSVYSPSISTNYWREKLALTLRWQETSTT